MSQEIVCGGYTFLAVIGFRSRRTAPGDVGVRIHCHAARLLRLTNVIAKRS